MPLENLRNWYPRRVEKPYEHAHDTGDVLHINLETTPASLPPAQQSATDAELRIKGANLILNYYGKVSLAESENIELSDVSITERHAPKRAYRSHIVQVTINKQLVEDEEDIILGNSLSGEEVLINTKAIKPFLAYITTSFKIYQQQLKFFNGSIQPYINFLDLLDKVKTFFENLENYVSFNGYKLSEYKSIRITFTSAYKIGGIILVAPDLSLVPLAKGNDYYFSTLKQGDNPFVNEIVSNFNSIFLNRKSQINWTQFLGNFMPNSQIDVNYYGKPRSETPADEMRKEDEDSDFGPAGITPAQKKANERIQKDHNNILRAFDEAQKSLEKSSETLDKRLSKIVAKIEEITGEVDRVLLIMEKYNITTLIEAALECLLYKTGFDGALPDFMPGVSPFDPNPPKFSIKFPALPEIKFPPIININKELQIQIEEGLKRAALSAVMSVIQTIAEVIKEICLMEVEETGTGPIGAIVEQFLNDGASAETMYDCFADFGFLGSPSNPVYETPAGSSTYQTLFIFLEAVSPLITPRELCDLFNGTASDDVLQVISNLIDVDYPNMRMHFPDNDAIEQFFICLGSLMGPQYCEDVYNNLSPEIPGIDPCTIEDLQPFQDIVDLLENVELYATPDMSCGAGIVPALAEIDSYNSAVTRLIDSLTAPVQQAFISDLGNYKAIITQPDPLSTKDQEKVRDYEEHLGTSKSSQEGGGTINTAGKDFIKGLIPNTLQNEIGAFAQIGQTLNTLADNTALQNLNNILNSRTFRVAPETKDFYENIEDNFLTSRLFDDDYASIVNSDPLNAAKYYSFLTSIILKADNAFTDYGRTISYIMMGRPLDDIIKIYDMPLPSNVPQPSEDLDYDFAGLETGIQPAYLRSEEAKDFRDVVTNFAAAVTGNDKTPLTADFITKLYPFAYFSLINSFAYQIATSELFDTEKMNKLSLFPKLCRDGSISNADLLDVEKIKQESLQEFVDNSCVDKEFELGPVRDAAILALVNVYLQTAVVDLMLKNIFIVEKFGVSYLGNNTNIVNELLRQVTNQFLVYYGGSSLSYGESYNFPGIVKKAAAITVRKIIDRDPAGFRYPITGDLTNQNQIDLIETNTNFASVDITNAILQDIAVRYLFEKRLMGTQEIVKEFFKVKGSNSIENYLLEGIPYGNIPDFVGLQDSPRLPAAWSIESNTLGTVGAKSTNRRYITKNSITEFERVKAFFTTFDYLRGGEEFFQKWAGPGSTDDREREAIDKEVESYMKYGAFLAEKYIEVDYSKSRLQDLIDAANASPITAFAPILEDVKNYFADQTPLSSTSTTGQAEGNRSMAADVSFASTGDPAATTSTQSTGPSERYLLSFDAFANGIEIIMELLTVAESMKNGGTFPVPFATRGHTAQWYSNHYWDKDLVAQGNPCRDDVVQPVPGTRSAARGLTIQFASEEQEWGLGDDGSDPRKLSDYTLIRNWVKDVQGPNRPPFKSDIPPEKKRLFSCGDDPAYRSETPIREIRHVGKFGEFDFDSPTSEWGGEFTKLEVLALKGMISKSLIEDPDAMVERLTDDNGYVNPFVYAEINAWGHGGSELSSGGVNTGQATDFNTWAYEELLVYSLKKPSSDLTGFNEGAHRGWVTLHGDGKIVFESKSFYVVVRAATPFWATGDAGYELATEHHLEEIVKFYVYLVLKKESLLDERNTNKAVASDIDLTAPFLDFENSVTANESEDYRENFDLMKAIFNLFPTESKLKDALGELVMGDVVPGPGIAPDSLTSPGELYTYPDDPAPGIPGINVQGHGFGTADGEEDAPDSILEKGLDNSYLQEFVKSIFPSVEMKTRLAYMTPAYHASHFHTYDSAAGDPSATAISNFMLTTEENVKRYKSFFIYGGGHASLAHIATNKTAGVNLTSVLFEQNEFQKFINRGGASNSFPYFIDDLFKKNKLVLAQGMAAQTEEIFGPGNMVDIDRILQYLYITGELKTYYSLFIGEDKDIFVDTKQTIILALQAAFGEESSDCAPGDLDNVLLNGAISAATPLANIGTSFANKMLKETPYYILKGLVELCEPHVIISKKIKEVSAFAFDQLSKGLDMAQMGANVGGAMAAIAEGQIRENCDDGIETDNDMIAPVDIPDMDQIIRLINTGINQKYPSSLPPEFKPSVARTGIDLEGTLPYSFIIPPLTPFGIIYLILRLAEYGTTPLEVEDCDDND